MQPPAGVIVASAEAIAFDLKILAQLSEAGPQAVILADTGAAQVVLVGLRSGQGVQDVRSASQCIAQALRGRATLQLGEVALPLRAGLVALIEANTRHSLVATTDCVLLLTLTPSPASHEPPHPLLAHLTPLVQRAAEEEP